MKKVDWQLPVISIDNELIKSTAEANKRATSVIGEQFGIRSPINTEVELLKTPRFTPTVVPTEAEVGKLDYKSTVRELIEPHKVMTDYREIEAWFRKNLHTLDRPMQYLGNEVNTMDPQDYETADLRILICRLSAYDAVGGSLTHGALAQLLRHYAKQQGLKIYIDMAFMPCNNEDAHALRDAGIPWAFGRSSKRHPRDFDVMFTSFALTMEAWNIWSYLKYSGIPMFKTQRKLDQKIRNHEYPLIIAGGVVSDTLEMIYGEVDGEQCAVDATILGDGEITLSEVQKFLANSVKAGHTKAEFLRSMHGGTHQWWYEPDLYVHTYDKEVDPTTGYIELRAIERKAGHEYAADVGELKRVYMDDLNAFPAFTEIPIHYDGTLGNSVDVQISSGCLCVSGSTIIETEFGFETIKAAHERLSPGENPIIQTRHGQFTSEGIVAAGKKKVRTYTFIQDDDGWEYKITCTDDHMLDVMECPDEKECRWRRAADIQIGEEVWAVELPDYEAAKAAGGRLNSDAQFYYSHLTTVALKHISEYTEEECYDVVNVDEYNEYIANALITHNSGGLCSFCVAKGTKVAAAEHILINIEDLNDTEEIESPYGPQVPEGIICQGDKECITITTKRGHNLTCTLDHKIMTYISNKIGMTPAGELRVGQHVQISQYATKEDPKQVRPLRDFLFPEPKRGEPLPEGVLVFDDRPKEEQELMKHLRKAGAFLDEIISIEPAGVQEIWDVWDVPKGHMFYANGFIVSNCHEAHTQGRWRERELDKVTGAVEDAVRWQGAEDAGFYSLTWSLHSQVYSLLLWNYERFGSSSLISQRADQASADPNFFKFQNTQGQGSTTIGVEGCSQRMRNYFNKSLHTDQLFRAVENAARGGMSGLKLFMILSGLETAEDVKEFCDLLKEINKRGKRIAKEMMASTGNERQPIKMNPSFMLLLNMPHTSLQWAPCAASLDLETDIARPIVETARECGFGFRTSLTRDRVRVSNWTAMIGREGTHMLVESGQRSDFLYYGPVAKRLTWYLDQNFTRWGYGPPIPEDKKEEYEARTWIVPVEIAERGWNYWFREKVWETVFPWDGVQTAMRRDYLWNQWLNIRKFVGNAYCLKTSVNLNPKCHDCGACDPIDKENGPSIGKAKAAMLTRKLEDSTMLIGREASRKDMTVRDKIRFKVDIHDEFYRYAPKNILARYITRAMLLALQDIQYDHPMIRSFLKVEGHSLRWAEGQGGLPWVCGIVLIDHSFNRKWNRAELAALIPKMNQLISRNGMRIVDTVVSDKLPEFGKLTYGLYTCTIPGLSLMDARENIGKLGIKDTYEHKKKVAAGKGAFKILTEIRTRSAILPMAMADMTENGTKVTYLASLETNPITSLGQAIGKKVGMIKPNPIWCLGYYKYDRSIQDDESAKVEEGDIFAALEGQALYCELTGEPIETDMFTGELFKSVTMPNLCLAADMANLKAKSELGIDTHSALTKK